MAISNSRTFCMGAQEPRKRRKFIWLTSASALNTRSSMVSTFKSTKPRTSSATLRSVRCTLAARLPSLGATISSRYFTCSRTSSISSSCPGPAWWAITATPHKWWRSFYQSAFRSRWSRPQLTSYRSEFANWWRRPNSANLRTGPTTVACGQNFAIVWTKSIKQTA